jgi:hypothetical protein
MFLPHLRPDFNVRPVLIHHANDLCGRLIYLKGKNFLAGLAPAIKLILSHLIGAGLEVNCEARAAEGPVRLRELESTHP